MEFDKLISIAAISTLLLGLYTFYMVQFIKKNSWLIFLLLLYIGIFLLRDIDLKKIEKKNKRPNNKNKRINPYGYLFSF